VKDLDLQKYKETYCIGILLLADFLVRCCYLDAVPRWDAATYWGGLVEAVKATQAITHWTELPRVVLQTYNVFGHPAMGYFGLLVLGQLIDFPNLFILNMTNALLATFSVYCVYKIFRWFLPKKDQLTEVLLATAIFALDPLFFGSSIFLNTDFPVLVFFTAALASLLYQRYGWFTIASFFMIFSKETGMIFWLALLGGVFVYVMLNIFREFREQGRLSLRQMLLVIPHHKPFSLSSRFFSLVCLITPGIVFKLYSEAQKGAMWAMGTGLKFDSKGWNCFGFNSRVVLNRAGEIFILNFHWLLVLLIIAALLIILVKRVMSGVASGAMSGAMLDVVSGVAPSQERPNLIWGIFPVLISFTGFLVFNLTYITYIIPRYVVSGGFFLIFFTVILLPLVLKASKIRKSIYGLIFILFTAQTFWTLDPLSKWVFGSTSFSKHKILQIDSASEALGNGFVYSAAFAAQDKLFNLMHKAMPLKPDSTIITSDANAGYAWNTMGGIYVNKTSLNRTIDWRNGFAYNIVNISNLKSIVLPANAFYVYMPWLAQYSNEAEELNVLRSLYKISEVNEVSFQGYSLSFYRLTRLVQ
jgi:hypothetical protein